VIGVLSIASPPAPPFQKVGGNYHVIDVIIFSMGDVHCNAYHSNFQNLIARKSYLNQKNT
jgi:hypothetical protein